MTKFAVKQVLHLLVCIIPCLTIRDLFQTMLTGIKVISSRYCALSRVYVFGVIHVRLLINYLHQVNSKFMSMFTLIC